MGAVPTTRLTTVEEFSRLPEDSWPMYHELRHGEIVSVTRPKFNHHLLLQRTLRRLLEEAADSRSLVDTEVPFRPLPEYEL